MGSISDLFTSYIFGIMYELRAPPNLGTLRFKPTAIL